MPSSSTRISKDIRANVKQGTRVSATIVDVFGGKASAKMLANGPLMHNLHVIGGPVQVGDAVYIDFTTATPTIVAVGRGATTSGASILRMGSGGGGGGGVTPTEGPGIDLVGAKIGLGGDTILLYRADLSPVAEFAATSVGLDLALAAVLTGDIIYLASMDIDGDHEIPAGVSIVGMNREHSILSGEITINPGSILENLTVINQQSSHDQINGVVVGITGGAGEASKIRSCDIYCFQCNDGTTYGVLLGTGSILEIAHSTVISDSNKGDSYAFAGVDSYDCTVSYTDYYAATDIFLHLLAL